MAYRGVFHGLLQIKSAGQFSISPCGLKMFDLGPLGPSRHDADRLLVASIRAML